jgi:hypothetical protein
MYPEARIDVEVSIGEDDVPKPDASTSQREAPDDNDAGDGGVSSAEPKAPNPISSSTLKQSNPSTTDLVSTDVPPSGRRGHKHLAATRRNKSLLRDHQVITQV